MDGRLDLQISNAMGALGSVCDQARQFLESRRAAADAVYLAMLAIEELVSNTIKYGYDDQAAHWIKVSVVLRRDKVEVEIVDDGRPFDPLSLSDPDVALPADEREIGGLGIFLVKRMSNSVEYRRIGNQNITRVVKSIS